MVVDVLRALGRRWYAVLVGLLLTAGLVYGASQASPPEYHARGLVLLLPSPAQVGEGGNPFLLLSGLEQPAGILVAFFSSAPARAEVEALSPTAEYQVGLEDSTRGPVIAVDVTSSSAEETMATLEHIVGRIPEELARLQEQVDAPADAAIGSMPLTVDQRARIDRSGTVRIMIAALVVGTIATGLAGFAIDSLVQRRRLRGPRRRRRGATRREPQPPTGSDPDPPTPPEEEPRTEAEPDSATPEGHTDMAAGSHGPHSEPLRVGPGA